MLASKELIEIGGRIRSLREATGLSQENAAMEAGLDRSYYGRIERGLINVSALNLLKIAKVLNVGVSEFFPEFQAGKSSKP